MKPTPNGRMPGGVLGIGEDWRAEEVVEIRVESVVRSAPAPRKPRPPELETATASGDVEIRRMGAEVIRGVDVQG